MKISSTKNLVVSGFALSLISVAFNSVVLSRVETRLKAIDSEYSALVESLGKQAAQLNEGDSRFDSYLIMHYLAFAVPPARAKDAREDAAALLKRDLTKYYAAANDIPPAEVTRVEAEEAGEAIAAFEKWLALNQTLQKTTDPSERTRLAAEIEKLTKEEAPPKSDLGAKLREVGKYSAAEFADNDIMLMSALMPIMKSFREQIVASIHNKENRIHELENQRSSLLRKSTFATYAAISFQIFGLMLILVKDLVKN